MAITRIAFNDTGTYTGAYYLILNPSFLDLNQSEGDVELNTVEDSRLKQTPYFDSRPYILRWNNIRSDYSGFTGMLATLQSYIDSVKYVNFGTADYAVPTLGWVKVRVKDVPIAINTGGAIKYNVEMILNPEVT